MDRPQYRILLIDDNAAIHADFAKILCGSRSASEIDATAAEFFGAPAGAPAAAAETGPVFELDSALQGAEGFAKVEQALQEKRPYALIFCDVRMPPGWDGVETLERIFARDADVQAVLCTAFSDYTYDQTIARLGRSSRLLILKKPFDPVEVQQLAAAQTEKWAAARRVEALLRDLRAAEHEARALASSLEMTNLALLTDKATAEAHADAQNELLGRFIDKLSGELTSLDAGLAPGWNGARLSKGLEDARVYVHLAKRDPAPLALAPFVPIEVCGAVLERLRETARQRNVELLGQQDEQGRASLLGDARLVEVSVATLLEFAIGCSTPGGVQLRMRTDPAGLKIEINAPTVKLAPDELSLAFEPFGTAHGLGPALARRAVQRLGGELDARCNAAGLALTLRLPMMAAERRLAA
ncbi:MAG: response regulator [Planctomycetes bacterium]|nr:response regulator [Planctomycetota bacterium]